MNSEENYMTFESFVFDSYAFFEILKGNENYNKYKNAEIVTTKLNLFEVYLGVLREHNEESAEKILNQYYDFAIDFDRKVITEAAKFKKKVNKRDLSMTDCISYILACQLGIKFLTGDKEFEGMEDVEFVK
jgi:predicted nucleic acid-binding protein